MKFEHRDKGDIIFEESSPETNLGGAQCEICKQNEWEHVAFSRDDEGLEYVKKTTGRGNGLICVCGKCLKEKLESRNDACLLKKGH
jgi:hypothetical protein